MVPRTLETITPKDFDLSFQENSEDGRKVLTWPKFVSSFDLTELEVEELAKRNSTWARLIELYKQKCRVTILNCIEHDPKLAWEYYQKE